MELNCRRRGDREFEKPAVNRLWASSVGEAAVRIRGRASRARRSASAAGRRALSPGRRTGAKFFSPATAGIVVMRFALRGAGFAGFRAVFTEFAEERCVASHERRAQGARISTVTAGLNALRNAASAVAGCRAIQAFAEQRDACVYTLGRCGLSHDECHHRTRSDEPCGMICRVAADQPRPRGNSAFEEWTLAPR